MPTKERPLHFSSRRLWMVMFSLLSYALIQFNALHLVVLVFGYFEPRALTAVDCLTAVLCTIGPALVLPMNRTPASCAAWIFYVFIYVSVGAVGIAMFDSPISYMSLMSFMGMGLALFHFAARLRSFTFAGEIRVKYMDVLLMLSAAALVLYAWRLAGFTLRIGLIDVYDRRFEVRATGGHAGYLLAPLALLLPVLAVYALQMRRNLAWPLLVGLGCLAVFSFDGTKSSLLYPVILLLIMSGIRSGRLPLVLLCFVACINLLAYLEYKLIGSLTLIDHVVRRAFIVPGMLTSVYWEFAPSVTDLKTITYEVGAFFYNSTETNANTNFLMWGFAWAGWWGGALVAICGGCIISLFASFPGVRFPWLGSLMACGCTLFWAEQFIHTSMLSSGVLWLLLIALVFKTFPEGFASLAQRGGSISADTATRIAE